MQRHERAHVLRTKMWERRSWRSHSKQAKEKVEEQRGSDTKKERIDLMGLEKKEKHVLLFIFFLPLLSPKWHCWTIKCCSAHLSPRLVSDTDRVATPIVTLNVCCGVPVISSRCRQPWSQKLTGGTQREAGRKWHLKFWENRMAQRD